MKKEQYKESLVDAVDNLAFAIDTLRSQQTKDYTDILIDIFTALKGIGHNNQENLNKIHHELHILNKTIIMSALLISATKNPEKTLNEYQKIIEQYLK